MGDIRLVCSLCGKEHRKERSYDETRKACTDRATCAGRAVGKMNTRPYIGGFSPEAAYAEAPKLGDAA